MQINANYYSISPPRFIAGTKGSYGIEKLEIVFSAEWDGLIKKVLFYPPKSDPVSVLYELGPIDIPAEVMNVRGRTKYAVIGYKDEKILVSVSGEIDVLGTLDDTDKSAVRPTPTEIAQVIEHMRTAIDVAESVRKDADNGVFNGRDGNVWHFGTAVDGTSDRIVCAVDGALQNHLYLNTDNFNLYISISDDIWSYIGTAKGGVGDKGEKGDKGDRGEQGIQGEKGDQGGFEFAGFAVDIETGILSMTTSSSFDELEFRLKNGNLEVIINE